MYISFICLYPYFPHKGFGVIYNKTRHYYNTLEYKLELKKTSNRKNTNKTSKLRLGDKKEEK